MADLVYWTGDVGRCQVCDTPFIYPNKDGIVLMFDARLDNGYWANVCEPCFDDRGCGLGTGRGQRYEKQPNDRWLKTGG